MARSGKQSGPSKAAKAAKPKGTAAAAKASVKARQKSPIGDERAAAPTADSGFLGEVELDELEKSHADGLTLAQVIESFARRGLHLSEATFRKYVQLGLLGRSRRVGRKGKHQGSMGLYPATTVRRINAIKQMMAASYTIEDIQRSFLRFTDEIEVLRRSLTQLMLGFENELKRGSFPADQRRALHREIPTVRKLADELIDRVESLERQLVSPLERAARERAFGSGAKGGAEELL